jgi:enoyl-CoA hydratase/carnithine racemase
MTATQEIIRREVGDDGVCILSFDRPDSGANIFDGPTMASLREHLDAIENDRQPRVNGEEALKVHRFIDALLRSVN